MVDATSKGLKGNEKVHPESEVKKLKARVEELGRGLGRKTMDREILKDAAEYLEQKAEEKTAVARWLVAERGWNVTRVAETVDVSRPHLSTSSRTKNRSCGPNRKDDDDELVERIRAIVRGRPTFGYRRVTAMLNRAENRPRVNHKRK